MTDNTTQLNLNTPDEIDWDHYDGAKTPPQAQDENGNGVVFYAQLPTSFEFGSTQDGNLKATIDPITLDNGYQIRFQSVSNKRFTDRKTNKPINASQMGNFLRSAGVATLFKPQTVDQYKAAVQATAGKVVPVVIDWECYDKQTKQQVKSTYAEFDGAPGQKSPIVKTPDGRTLVARARVKAYLQQQA